ncbi:MAG: HAD-IIIC family phosphatase, partial [Candidatus Omnitrophica bacterium]|nr:HAD-IIIC family phosphatase [Candidatus Omnitrophota bacterium]
HLLGESNLQGLLTGFGYPANYLSTYYKLYGHYLSKGLDLPQRYGELLQELGNKKLDAFIRLLAEAKEKDNFHLLGESNLQGLLTGFGYPANYLSTYYKLYGHYLSKGLDLPQRYGELLQELGNKKLDAFIRLLAEAKEKDNFHLLGEGNLQGLLTGFGYPANYLSTCYKFYLFWKEKGIDVDKEYDWMGYEGTIFNSLLNKIKPLGWPKGKFTLPISFYLYKVLQCLGKKEPKYISLDEIMPSWPIQEINPEERLMLIEEIQSLCEIAGDKLVKEALSMLAKEFLATEEKSTLDEITRIIQKKLNAFSISRGSSPVDARVTKSPAPKAYLPTTEDRQVTSKRLSTPGLSVSLSRRTVTDEEGVLSFMGMRKGWFVFFGKAFGNPVADKGEIPQTFMGSDGFKRRDLLRIQPHGNQLLFGSDEFYLNRFKFIQIIGDIMSIPESAFFFKGLELWNVFFHRLLPPFIKPLLGLRHRPGSNYHSFTLPEIVKNYSQISSVSGLDQGVVSVIFGLQDKWFIIKANFFNFPWFYAVPGDMGYGRRIPLNIFYPQIFTPRQSIKGNTIDVKKKVIKFIWSTAATRPGRGPDSGSSPVAADLDEILDDECRELFNKILNLQIELKQEDIYRVKETIDYSSLASGEDVRLVDWRRPVDKNDFARTVLNLDNKDLGKIKALLEYIYKMRLAFVENNCYDLTLIDDLPEMAATFSSVEYLLDALFIEFTFYDLGLKEVTLAEFEQYCTLHGTTFTTHPVLIANKIEATVFSRYKKIIARDQLRAFIRSFAESLRNEPQLSQKLHNIGFLLKYFSAFSMEQSSYGYAQPEQENKRFAGLSRIKCIVVDCDNVLWKGIIDEARYMGLGLELTGEHRAFQRILLEAKDCGFILAINSKNNKYEIEHVLRDSMQIKPEDFAVIKDNGQNKAENLAEISRELNINLDSLIFFDDSPHERELVRLIHPEVLVPDFSGSLWDWIKIIYELITISGRYATAEDKIRTELYDAKRRRDELKRKAATLEDYYRSLNMKVVIRQEKENQPYIRRIAQLTARTNQFNLSGKIYTDAEIISMLDKPESNEIFTLELFDIFGSAGIVALAILRNSQGEWAIEDFYLSCRAIGLEVERAFIAYIISNLRKKGISVLRANYRWTGRNGLVINLYEKLGFSVEEDTDKRNKYTLELCKSSLEIPNWITIINSNEYPSISGGRSSSPAANPLKQLTKKIAKDADYGRLVGIVENKKGVFLVREQVHGELIYHILLELNLKDFSEKKIGILESVLEKETMLVGRRGDYALEVFEERHRFLGLGTFLFYCALEKALKEKIKVFRVYFPESTIFKHFGFDKEVYALRIGRYIENTNLDPKFIKKALKDFAKIKNFKFITLGEPKKGRRSSSPVVDTQKNWSQEAKRFIFSDYSPIYGGEEIYPRRIFTDGFELFANVDAKKLKVIFQKLKAGQLSYRDIKQIHYWEAILGFLEDWKWQRLYKDSVIYQKRPFECDEYALSVNKALSMNFGITSKISVARFASGKKVLFHTFLEVKVCREKFILDLSADQFEIKNPWFYRYHNLGVVLLPFKIAAEHSERFWMYFDEAGAGYKSTKSDASSPILVINNRGAHFKCSVENIKEGGAEILLQYQVYSGRFGGIPFTYILEGEVYIAGKKPRVGSFLCSLAQNQMQLLNFYPIGKHPASEEWLQNNRNKGISQTLLFWLASLAKENGAKQIYAESPWLMDYYIFRKYFAQEIKIIPDPKNWDKEKEWRWQEIKQIQNLYDYRLLGNILLLDPATFVPIAEVGLFYIKGKSGHYQVLSKEDLRRRNIRIAKLIGQEDVYVPRKYADELKEGDIVSIDEKAFMTLRGQVIAIVGRPSGDFLIRLRGSPRIPADIAVHPVFDKVELINPGADFKIKVFGEQISKDSSSSPLGKNDAVGFEIMLSLVAPYKNSMLQKGFIFNIPVLTPQQQAAVDSFFRQYIKVYVTG